MKKDQKYPQDDSRRKFLCGSAAAGLGVAVAAAVPGAAAADAVEQSSDDSGEKGYRLTQHIVDYYKTTAS